jgi:hypothetical protein
MKFFYVNVLKRSPPYILRTFSRPIIKSTFATQAKTSKPEHLKMKRSRPAEKAGPKAKKQRIDIPEYHSTLSHLNENGDPIWPAPKDQMDEARTFIVEW